MNGLILLYDSRRKSKAVATFWAIVSLLIMLVSAPAWSRGGGGFGGHGGFGGGGHFGGYGGYSGGYHSYYGGGGYYRNYYYPGYGYHSYGGYRPWDDFWLVFLVLFVVLALLSQNRGSVAAPKTLVVVTLILKNGQEYTSLFHGFSKSARLNSPNDRTVTAHEVVHIIRESDIFLGTYRRLQSSTDSTELGMTAKAIWQEEMTVSQIKADVINVSTPTEKLRADFGTPQFDPDAAAIGTDAYCMVSIIASASGFWPGSNIDRPTVVNAMHRLGSANIDALYFYFTPSAGKAFSRNTAVDIIEKLQRT